MNKKELVSAIEQKKGTLPYSSWTIGITNDPERRKKEQEEDGNLVTVWYYWETDSELIARKVENYFLDKGMNGGEGGGENPRYIYIF